MARRESPPTTEGAAVTDGAAVDPDVDLHVAGQRREWADHPRLLPVIAGGGMLGASGRYALEQAAPAAGGALPWATLAVNVSGCALIGVLMVCLVELGGSHPLLRPFLGVGVLGGYTTFSTYAVQAHALLLSGRPALALGYLLGTAVATVTAVAVAVSLARAFVRVRGRRTRHGSRVRSR